MKQTYSAFVIIIFCLGFLFSCRQKKENKQIEHRDLPLIEQSGELTALTLYGSISYFIYKEEEMGYEYELIKSFAESRGLKLKIKVAGNVSRLSEMLENGEGDVIAYHLPMTKKFKDKFIYCGKETVNEQVLVQRSTQKDTILKNVIQLIGKEVWVVEDSKYHHRLVNLNEEVGGGIIIRTIEKDTVSVEDLIEQVSKDSISYTLSDNDLASLNKTYYSNININTKVSHPQPSAWAVNKGSFRLAEAIDEWSKENVNNPRYKSIMKRYFEMSKDTSELKTVHLYGKGKISPYDELFKKYAAQIDWDWRLLASLSYQESKFHLDRESWAGAVGLMGLMPRTAKAFGITSEERLLPEPSIKAGVAYIKRLKNSYSGIKDNQEQLKFVLASYNSGIAHINDAQALARKYGKDPMVWDENVEECLKWKHLPEYYNDSVCKYGYFRGTETLEYVEEVIGRWKFYQEKVK